MQKPKKVSIYLDSDTMSRIEFIKSQGYEDSLSTLIREAIAEFVPSNVIPQHVHFEFHGWKCPDCGWIWNGVKR
jgi:rubrerythrin